MLSQEMNELLTKVGPGTPTGELLRRYWQPICVASELSDDRPKKRVTVMEENLVVYKDHEGNYGCVAEQCAHRGCSLYYGFLEDGGIRCAYHGWKYDRKGNCLEMPFETKGSKYQNQISQKTYPVQKLGGLLFVYMGPEPAPLLPRWDVLVRRDGDIKLQVNPVLNCNWLQAQENSLDTVHTYYLHGHMMRTKNLPGGEYYYRDIEKYDFELCEWGIVKKRTYKDEKGVEEEKGHPAVFPNMLRVPQGPHQVMHWRVPIDDTHTQIFLAYFKSNADRSLRDLHAEPLVEYLPEYMTPEGEYECTNFFSQDQMAWETQGPIYDRTKEHLGASDRGIAMWRRLMQEQIQIVENGGEPMALVRDPEQNLMINFETSDGQARDEFLRLRQDYYG